jgi:hypothetical protein
VDVVRKYDLGREREWSGSLHLADGVSIKIDRNYVPKSGDLPWVTSVKKYDAPGWNERR